MSFDEVEAELIGLLRHVDAKLIDGFKKQWPPSMWPESRTLTEFHREFNDNPERQVIIKQIAHIRALTPKPIYFPVVPGALAENR